MTSVIADSATHTLGPSTIAPQIIPAEMAAVTLRNHSAQHLQEKFRNTGRILYQLEPVCFS